MNCPSDIADIVLEILHLGALRIRLFAGIQQSKKCFIEADHLHNLPHLLADYRPDRLRFYWQTERPSFMRQVPEDERRDLEPLWNRLAELIEQHELLEPAKATG